MDLIKSSDHNFKKIKYLNLTIKELHHISLVFLSNNLYLSKPIYHLDLIKSSYLNYKKNKIFKYITIKELHHISLIFLSNNLYISNHNHHLDLIKSSDHNYKKNKIFKYITIKELYHISLIFVKVILYSQNIFNSFRLMQHMIENLKYLKFIFFTIIMPFKNTLVSILYYIIGFLSIMIINTNNDRLPFCFNLSTIFINL